MIIQHQEIAIRQSPMTEVYKVVHVWHTPVYVEKFGRNKVSVTRESVEIEINEVEAPTLDSEMLRLQGLGVEDNTKEPWVNVAYGKGVTGRKALEEAMKKAAKKPGAKSKAVSKPETESAESDLLD